MKEKDFIDLLVNKLSNIENIEVKVEPTFSSAFSEGFKHSPDLLVYNKETNTSLYIDVKASLVPTSTGTISLPLVTLSTLSDYKNKLHSNNPNSDLLLVTPLSISKYTEDMAKKSDLEIISTKDKNIDEVVDIIINKSNLKK